MEMEVKKRKVERDSGVEEVSPSKKSKKKNTFNVVDVDEEEAEEKDFLKLSRSQVVEDYGDANGKNGGLGHLWTHTMSDRVPFSKCAKRDRQMSNLAEKGASNHVQIGSGRLFP